jgi:hypothetical protein
MVGSIDCSAVNHAEYGSQPFVHSRQYEFVPTFDLERALIVLVFYAPFGVYTIVASLYLTVGIRGGGYVAECRVPAVIVLGPSAAEVAENARLKAMSAFGKSDRPENVIVRVDEPGHTTIAVQPADEHISLPVVDDHSRRRYFRTVVSDVSFRAVE